MIVVHPDDVKTLIASTKKRKSAHPNEVKLARCALILLGQVREGDTFRRLWREDQERIKAARKALRG